MIRWLLHRMISGFEKQTNYDATYMHEIADVSRSAAARLSFLPMINQYKADAPPALWYGAGIASVLDGDCGPCTQLMVDAALHDGVSEKDISAMLCGDLSSTSQDAALGFRFGMASIDDDPIAHELREQIIAQYGKKALIAVAYVTATARTYPVLKRALGFGAACQNIKIGDVDQAVIRKAA